MASRSTSRAGFTLVEVLVVILIISILIALLVPALGYAVRKAERFGYTSDLTAIEQALEAYRGKYTDYPPDFSDAYDGSPRNWQQTTTYRHVRKAFPRIAPEELVLLRSLTHDLPGDDPARLDAAEALVFWLGGLSNNPRFPFTGEGGPLFRDSNGNLMWRIEGRMNALMTFKEDRLGPNPNDPQRGMNLAYAPVYLPANGRTSPYIYFDARTYGFSSYLHPLNSEAGVALPYFGRMTSFANPETFQVICAGSDDIYNTAYPLYTSYPSGFPVSLLPNGSIDTSFTPDPAVNYFLGQEDNLGNFSEGSTLGEAREQ